VRSFYVSYVDLAIYAGSLLFVVLWQRSRIKAGKAKPYSQRPYPHSERTRQIGLLLVTLLGILAMLLAVWGAVEQDWTTAATGVVIAIVLAWFANFARRLGRDVTAEQLASVEWERPWTAYVLVLVNGWVVVMGVLGAASGTAHRSWGLAALFATFAVIGAVMIRASFRMRLAKPGTY
jgi:hypothetical protein